MRYKIAALNIPVLLIAFCISVVTWYAITIDERTEMQLTVKLDYNNIPKDLIITSGLVDSIKVTLRGPRALLANHSTEKPYMINLSHLQRGENLIPFTQPGWDSKFRAFEVLSVSPAQATIVAETLVERNVPIRPQILTTLHASAFKVQDISVSPNTALLRGPESSIANTDHLMLDIRVNAKEQPGTYTKNYPLITGKPQTTVSPTSIAVTYTVSSQRTRIHMQRNILINGPENIYAVTPQYVQFEVEAPEALVGNTSYLEQVEARLTPPILEPEQSTTGTVTLFLPDGMTIVTPVQEVVTVKRLK